MPRWLGCRLYRCATCQQTVSASGPPRGRKGPSYRCPVGDVTRAAGRLDEYVAAVINARLARPDAADLLAPRGSEPDLPGLRKRAADLRELLNEQARLHAPRRHRRPAARGREHRAALRAQRRRGRLAAVIRRERLDPIAGRPDAAALWQTLDLGRQRAVVTALCTVTLGPAMHGRLPGGAYSRHQPPRDSVHLAPVNRARSCVSASTTGLTAASVPMRSAPRTALHPAAT
jgi:site-specific DNA recombinase